MNTRPRTLREAVAMTPAATPAADSFGSESMEIKEAADASRRGVLVRVSPDIRRALKLAAIERGTTVQNLLLEAIAVVLNRHDEAAAPSVRKGP